MSHENSEHRQELNGYFIFLLVIIGAVYLFLTFRSGRALVEIIYPAVCGAIFLVIALIKLFSRHRPIVSKGGVSKGGRAPAMRIALVENRKLIWIVAAVCAYVLSVLSIDYVLATVVFVLVVPVINSGIRALRAWQALLAVAISTFFFILFSVVLRTNLPTVFTVF